MANIDFGIMGAELVYVIVAAVVGLACLITTAAFVPAIIDRLTPNINEEREIVRGNRAVAEYFGRMVQAIIIGMALIIAASIIAGIGRPGVFAA